MDADTTPDSAVFGQWLRRRRRALDLTQKELALRTGCSAATIRKLESDERRPSKTVASALAQALGVDAEERPAFVRFARSGWADTPPRGPRAAPEKPWLLPSQPAPEHPVETVPSAPGPRRRAPLETPALAAPARPRSPFFARRAELERLDAALRSALAGRGGIVLVEGEAGQGKTALLTAFAARAQDAVPELLTAVGACNAYTGAGDPFLPFREILEQLTLGPLGEAVGDAVESERCARLRRFADANPDLLREHGPHLRGPLLPEDDGAGRAGRDPTAASRPPAAAGPLGDVAALRAEAAAVLREAARRAPLLLLVDDLHWADTSSIELMLYLTRRLAAEPILVVGAYRPPSSRGERASIALATLLVELERRHGRVVIDLHRADAHAFLEACLDSVPNALGADFRDALWRQTGGQPLFTLELLRALQERGDLSRDAAGMWRAREDVRWDALPDRVAGALDERLARLGRLARDVVRVASVEGDIFSAEVVAHVLHRDARAIVRVAGEELAARRRLLEPVDVRRGSHGLVSRYRFRHSLIQRYAYDKLAEDERAYLHDAVANALDAGIGGEASPLALGFHRLRARAPGRAALHFRAAGDMARRGAALTEAVQAYELALEHWPEGHPEGRAAVLRNLGEGLCLAGQLDRGLELLREARAAYEARNDTLAAAEAQSVIGGALKERGDWTAALEACREGLQMLDGSPDSADLASVLSNLAGLQLVGCAYEEAASLGERALRIARTLQAEEKVPGALLSTGSALAYLGPERRDEGLAMLHECRELGIRLGQSDCVAAATMNIADVRRAVGHVDAARTSYEDAVDAVRRFDLTVLTGMPMAERWRLEWQCGRWGWAFDHWEELERLADTARQPSAGQGYIAIRLAAAELDLGRPAAASALLEAHDGILARLGEPQARIPLLRERLRLAAATGREHDASDLAQQIIAFEAGRGTHSDEVLAPLLTACRWLAHAEASAARDALRAALEVLDRTERQYGSPAARATREEALGVTDLHRGEVEQGTQRLAQAARIWKAAGFPFDEARARVSAAHARERLGRHRDGARDLERAKTLLRGLASQVPAGGRAEAFGRNLSALLDRPPVF